MRQTTMAKPAEVKRTWYVVDGEGQTLGRLATTCAHVLRGKHKPTYTPNVDCGDCVIVINADKVNMTGNKLETEKYYNHSGYFGGLRYADRERNEAEISSGMGRARNSRDVASHEAWRQNAWTFVRVHRKRTSTCSSAAC